MKVPLTIGFAALVVAGCNTPLEIDSQASPLAPAAPAPAARHPVDAAPTAQHPEAANAADRAFERAQLRPSTHSLSGFAEKYSEAGSPRVAILFNRQFASQLSSWTMESKEVLQDVRAVALAGVAQTDHSSRAGQTATARTTVEGAGVKVQRSESFQEFENPGERHGFSSEYVEWKFREGFSAPFFSAGMRLVDSDLIVQATSRTEAAKQRISDVNTNLAALKEKADWIVEVLMVRDGRAATGYLFRAEVKDLESGTILASATSDFDEFNQRPVRRKISAVSGGYRVEEEELPAPTLEEYAEDLAVRLLSELNRRLGG